MPDRIELTAPTGRAFEPVIRMVMGGIADRLDLGFEDLDDLQLAVESLLAEGDPVDPITLSFEVSERGVRTRIGPLRDQSLAAAARNEGSRTTSWLSNKTYLPWARNRFALCAAA